MSGLQIATVVMSVASIGMSCCTIYWSAKARRINRETARLRAERMSIERRPR